MDIDNIKKINTRKELAFFIKELAKDSQKGTWENNKLDDFLEALSACLEDMEGFYLNRGLKTPEKPEWKTFAELLISATMYE